jgi:hypothetical protein
MSPVKNRSAVALLVLASTLSACSLDVTNPNAATEGVVVSTPAGLKAVAVGLQGRFGNSLEHALWVPGIVSGELGNTDASQSTQREFQKYPDASANAPRIETNNPELLNFWSRQYQVIRSANDILDNIDGVTLAPGTKSGMTALAKTLKAIALGTLIEAWQEVPLDPSQANPVFSNRATVLGEVLDLLASARDDITTTAPSTEFTSQILTPGIDLLNTIRAMQARFSVAAGQYEEALTFANEVPANATSEYRYSTVDQNPVWGQIQSNKYFAAIASFRTDAEAGDTRVNKTGTTVTTPFGGAQVIPVAIYTTSSSPLPIFTQDELTLIRAEAHARANRLPEAIDQINIVRTQYGLAPIDRNAATTQAAVLDEIFRQRRYSLFLSGLRWADERRFGKIDQARVTWLPYPAQETVDNPNAPANP